MTEALDAKLIAQIIGGVIVVVIGAFMGRSVLIRRSAKDGVVVAASGGEVSLIERLNADILRREAERVTDYQRWAAREAELLARADRLNEERNAAIEQIGSLRQQVHHLSAKVLDLSSHVERLERVANAHKEAAEGLRVQLDAFMKLHEIGADKPGESTP